MRARRPNGQPASQGVVHVSRQRIWQLSPASSSTSPTWLLPRLACSTSVTGSCTGSSPGCSGGLGRPVGTPAAAAATCAAAWALP